MDEEITNKILNMLDRHRTMTIATLRPDGWPQATTVGYANEGLTLYFVCALDSQKAANLARDDRVSLTIDHDTPQVVEITGLSMAAHARAFIDPAEASKAFAHASIEVSGPAGAHAGRCQNIPGDAKDHLRRRLLQGLWTHRSRHLLIDAETNFGIAAEMSAKTAPPRQEARQWWVLQRQYSENSQRPD